MGCGQSWGFVKHLCRDLYLEQLKEAKAKEKQREAGGPVPQKSVKPPVDTQKEIAKIDGGVNLTPPLY